MKPEDIIKQAEVLRDGVLALDGAGQLAEFYGLRARIVALLSHFWGSGNEIVRLARESKVHHEPKLLAEYVQSFIDHMRLGLIGDIGHRRQAELDVVSELLGQAQVLLQDDTIHPTAPAVLTGAALEEFLRQWTYSRKLYLGRQRPGLAAYVRVLKDHELIDKQDLKDIDSWSGLRNEAAHGQWLHTPADDRQYHHKRTQMMLDGTNLFIRKHTS